MSERLKNPESAAWLIDGLGLCHPNTAQAEAARQQSDWQTVSFRGGSTDWVREVVSHMPNRPSHQRELNRRAHHQRVEQGEPKVFCDHETHLVNSGYLERLVIGQRRWGDCDGQLEIRAHHPAGWDRASAVWLTSRPAVRQEGGVWFEIPNLTFLTVRSYNFLQGSFEYRLLQVDHGRGEEMARSLVVRDQIISSARGYQIKVPRPAPKVEPWSSGDEFWPLHYDESLRSLPFGAEGMPKLAPEVALDGIVDCRRIAEAIRAQAETGPVDLARLASDTGLSRWPAG